MIEKMPCGITDGPQTPEDAAELMDLFIDKIDPDDAYDRQRQQDLDDMRAEERKHPGVSDFIEKFGRDNLYKLSHHYLLLTAFLAGREYEIMTDIKTMKEIINDKQD